MPLTPSLLLQAALGKVSLNILLFGPPVRHLSNDPNERPLQDKRSEIWQALNDAGHNVRLAENVVEPGFTTSLPYHVIMREYDVVISYISSGSAITEIDIIRSSVEVADKAIIFLDTREDETAVGSLCRDAVECGAVMVQYAYPDDLDSCRLKGKTLRHVHASQTKKHML